MFTNTNASKYCCPGCSARTCSLPCYKRHQQWAQCSGHRDPTKFVKKSQLVTPAGIDHDFNFLTGIERNIDKAEQGLNVGGDGSTATPKSWSRHAQKGETNYQHLEAAGVQVIRAPKGLSRQKENKSHRSNKKKPNGHYSILWTVEWLDDQQKRLLTETSSTCQIVDANPFALKDQHKGKKRKRNVDGALATTTSNSQNASPSQNQDESVLDINNNLQVLSKEPEHPSPRRRATNPDSQEDEETQTNVAETHTSDTRHDGPSAESVGNGQYRFYLVKPRTSTSRRVLIPLEPTSTLSECLRGRTVLEYPTIYAFPGNMPTLPQEFMLEDDYAREEAGQEKEFDELMGQLDPGILKRLRDDGGTGHAREKAEVVDESRILDVLKKDFGSALGTHG
ncbi:hypothetical protein BKA63DRAFT_241602 [Paraphoma chrysanthemicola]|nr:hypothetical protein BKA63DRAFT_241602 [Paraphoma chrysanthemicola]